MPLTIERTPPPMRSPPKLGTLDCCRFDLILVLRAETSTLFDRLQARYERQGGVRSSEPERCFVPRVLTDEARVKYGFGASNCCCAIRWTCALRRDANSVEYYSTSSLQAVGFGVAGCWCTNRWTCSLWRAANSVESCSLRPLHKRF